VTDDRPLLPPLTSARIAYEGTAASAPLPPVDTTCGPEFVAAQPMPIADTELDDEIEQILGRFLDDSLERIHARNAICAAISARGYDVYARRQPDARLVAAAEAVVEPVSPLYQPLLDFANQVRPVVPRERVVNRDKEA
jgi:hypothetical protein